MIALPAWFPDPLRVGIVLALVLSLLGVAVAGSSGDRLAIVRRRLVMGVPWGTLVSALFVLAVYLFVQGGLEHWYRPLRIPFASWSYLYPPGWLAAPFAHASPAHLTGNLLGTLALAPLAEYAWGHFPTRRGSQSFSSWRTNPWIRALLLFPAGVLVVGVVTSLFAWGPIIGFSGVVFAFAGFALVRYPLTTVVALSVPDLLGLILRALREPVLQVTVSPGLSRPWWYGIAIQGHLLGLLLGVILGVAVVSRRGRRPSAARLWVGTLLLSVSMTLWAVWWYRGAETYVLYRGLGVILVLMLAALVTAGARASDRFCCELPAVGNLSRRQVAVALLVVPLLVMAPTAVVLNLSTVTEGDPPGDGPSVTVRDYTVTYAEGVTNQKVAVIDISLFGESTQVETSGLIVTSERRHIWTTAISTSRLAFRGRASVPIGGLGWRESVAAKRQGWVAAGGKTAYHVWIRQRGGPWRHAFASDPARAEPVIAGKNVSIVPRDGSFYVRVSRENETIASAPLPQPGASVRVSGIRFVREEKTLIAAHNRTRVTVATVEEYH